MTGQSNVVIGVFFDLSVDAVYGGDATNAPADPRSRCRPWHDGDAAESEYATENEAELKRGNATDVCYRLICSESSAAAEAVCWVDAVVSHGATSSCIMSVDLSPWQCYRFRI
jgi:hypothetical protein